MFKKIMIFAILIFAPSFIYGCGGGFVEMVRSSKPELEVSLNPESSVVCSGVTLMNIPVEVCFVQNNERKQVCMRASFLKYCVDI